MSVSPGLYQHYKGHIYRVLFLAKDSTNVRAGESLVVYFHDSEHGMHVRSEAEFEEIVEWPDGERMSRFVRLMDQRSTP